MALLSLPRIGLFRGKVNPAQLNLGGMGACGSELAFTISTDMLRTEPDDLCRHGVYAGGLSRLVRYNAGE
jgi:hypothetical protein